MLWALLVHILVIFLLLVQWPTQRTPVELLPKHIKASLVEIKTVKPKPRKLPVVVDTVVPLVRPVKSVPAIETAPRNKNLPKADIDFKALKDINDELPAEQLAAPLLGEDIVIEQQQTSQALTDEQKEQALVARYALAIRQRVEKFWSRPPSTTTDMQVQLGISLVPTGEVVNVVVLNGSGYSVFDRSASQAVKKAARFDVPENNRMFEKYFRQFRINFSPEGLRP